MEFKTKNMTTYSDWVSITGTTSPEPLEDEPQNLTIKNSTHNSQTIGWAKSEAGNETAYEVRFKLDGEPEFGTPLEVQGLEHTFTGLQPSTKYIYEIRSVKK